MGLAQSAGKPSRDVTAPDPVYRAQFAGTLSRPGCTIGLPLAAVRVAPPMMLLIARAATWRLSIGFAGLYGWCRFSDHATWPPWAGLIGSRPCRPVLIDAKLGLLPLVISENTHRICRVDLPQAK